MNSDQFSSNQSVDASQTHINIPLLLDIFQIGLGTGQEIARQDYEESDVVGIMG